MIWKFKRLGNTEEEVKNIRGYRDRYAIRVMGTPEERV